MALELNDEEYGKFYNALRFTIPHEGGYVNDPDDAGGETKWGISKRYNPDIDIKELTPEQAAEIYYEKYWTPAGCSELEHPLYILMFDTAVLFGVGRAKEFLAQTRGNYMDFCQLRKNYHILRVKQNPKQQKFLAGWLARTRNLEELNLRST
jgi:lysozyme family protein